MGRFFELALQSRSKLRGGCAHFQELWRTIAHGKLKSALRFFFGTSLQCKLADKKVEVDAALKQLADDNQLRTTAANEAAKIEQTVKEDEKNVDALAAKTAKDSAVTTKPNKNISPDDLDKKMEGL